MLPLGSPAAGTLPPAAVSATNVVVNNMSATSNQKQPSIDYKPYKPKFHNAALYNTAKEAAAAAASSTSTDSSFEMRPLTHASIVVPQKDMSHIQKPSESPHTSNNHQQQHLPVASEHQKVTTTSVHLPLPPQQSPNHVPHHPSLSPSTQMKLNNHINTHQLQQHQVQTPAPSHRLFGKPPQQQSKGLPLLLSAPVYYIGQPPAAPSSALLHPSAHLPTQPFFNAALHSMSPQQQQQFLYQLHIRQMHLQQQQLQIEHSSRVAAAAVIPKPPSPLPSPHQQISPSIPPPNDMAMKSSNQLPNTQHMIMTSTSARNLQHTKAAPPATNTAMIQPPAPQNPLHYLATTTNVASVALNSSHPTNPTKIVPEIVDQNATLNSQRAAATNLVASSNNPNTLLQTSGLQEVALVSCLAPLATYFCLMAFYFIFRIRKS